MDKTLASNELAEISEEITGGKKLLSERNKHLLLADKYWRVTVECYTAEQLARDSEDEKRIKCALKESKSLRIDKKSEGSRQKTKKGFSCGKVHHGNRYEAVWKL